MIKFQPDAYCPVCSQLLIGAATCPLGPGTPTESVRAQLESLTSDSIVHTRQLADPDMASCCVSGLWLLHNYLDESHSISQSIATPSGSYWHGIMHRREPDFSNAKYWFRRVGDHPVFPELCQAARELAGAASDRRATYLKDQTEWDPDRFVDLCQQAIQEHGELESLCRSVSELEWQLLFDHCYRHATN